MSYTQVYPNFNVWYDADGTPLNGGTVYIGQGGLDPESNPITVYFDTALTVPASQPLNTLNGYIENGGTPANIYIPNSVTSYSIRSKNSAGTTIFNALNVETLGINFGYPTAPTGKSYFNSSSPSNEQDYIDQDSSGTLYQFYANGALADGGFNGVQGNNGTFNTDVTVGGVSVRSGSILNSGTIDNARLPSPMTNDINNSNTDTDTLTINTTLTSDGVTDLNGNIKSSNGQVASAWVSFDGTATPSINDQYNVASITDNGTGDYTINFDTALPNANYAIRIASNQPFHTITSKTTSNFRLAVQNFSFNPVDPTILDLVVFCKQ